MPLPFATTAFGIFAIVAGVNTEDKVAPFDGFDPVLEVTGDGSELTDALQAGTFGVSVARTADGSTLRTPGPVDPTEVAWTEASLRSTVALDTDAASHGFDLTLQPTLADGSPFGGPVNLSATVNGGPVYAPTGGGFVSVVLVSDPTGDALGFDLLAEVRVPEGLDVRLDPPSVVGTTGAGVLDVTPAELLGQTVRLGASAATWTSDAGAGEGLLAEVDVGGAVQQREAVVQQARARITRVKLTSAGTVEVDVAADAAGRVADVVVTVETFDGSDGAMASAAVARIDTNFAILLDRAAIVAPRKALGRAARDGLPMVVHSLDATGATLQSQLVSAPVAITGLGADVGLATSGADGGVFGRHLADPAVVAIEAELFDALGQPVLTGPVVMDRHHLAESRVGDLGRPWEFATTHSTVWVEVVGDDGSILDVQALEMSDQFGEILIDGVVWEIE